MEADGETQAEAPVIAMEDTVVRVDRDEKIGRRKSTSWAVPVRSHTGTSAAERYGLTAQDNSETDLSVDDGFEL